MNREICMQKSRFDRVKAYTMPMDQGKAKFGFICIHVLSKKIIS